MTFQDQSTSNAEAPWTIGCKVTVGQTDYTIDYFLQDSSSLDALFSNSTSVTGQAVGSQSTSIKLAASDVPLWTAGDTYVGVKVGASTVTGNKNYPCYFSKALPKLGRNPNDFNKTFKIEIGARIYADTTATTFTDLGQASSTLALGAPQEF
jgi:hypothetical protein